MWTRMTGVTVSGLTSCLGHAWLNTRTTCTALHALAVLHRLCRYISCCLMARATSSVPRPVLLSSWRHLTIRCNPNPEMASQVFALIVGIDKYKAGNIWNLQSCVDDARSVEHWLTHDLQVPHSQVCVLLDSHATKRNIEDKFMSHLVNNPAIEPGDAIMLYFAGHGSTIRAPPGWFDRGRGDVQVLCPYDHDTKVSKTKARIAGISDRSLHAMIRDLCEVKGDNISLFLDTCFSLPPPEDGGIPERQQIRFTPTVKASSDDLLAGLWRSAVPHRAEPIASRGFTGTSYDTHVVLAAGSAASEGKGGGNFTTALMTLTESRSLHKLTYADLPHELMAHMSDHQHAVCAGMNSDRILFDGLPFVSDPRFVFVTVYDNENLKVDVGAIHGVAEGTEFSLHHHNRRGSSNPALGTLTAVEVHPTWCLARSKSSGRLLLREGWARISRWNHTPFRVHIRRSFLTFLRRLRLTRQIPSKTEGLPQKGGVSILCAKRASRAEMSVKLRCRDLIVERHDPLISSTCRPTIRVPSDQVRTDRKTIEAAARFHMHLYRRNPQRPLLGSVSMELFRLDPSSWTRVSGNMLVKGRAQIVDDEKSSIYAVVLHNYSDVDLWPYLAYMDAGGYSITMVYHPDPSSSAPPLRAHSHMVIGSGSTDSEALSFTLSDGAESGAGFLKLFLSATYTPMTILEQGPPSPTMLKTTYPANSRLCVKTTPHGDLWDSLLASITVIRTPDVI